MAMFARRLGGPLSGAGVEQVALAKATHSADRFHALLVAHEAAIAAAAVVAAILRAPGVFDRRGGPGEGCHGCDGNGGKESRIEPGHSCRPGRKDVTL